MASRPTINLDDTRGRRDNGRAMDGQDNESLGELLTRLRTARKMTLARLASESRVSTSYINKLELTGSVPSRENTKSLARVLDPDGRENLMFHRDRAEFGRLGYDSETAEILARLVFDRELREEVNKVIRGRLEEESEGRGPEHPGLGAR